MSKIREVNLENDDIEIDELLYRYFRKELSLEEVKVVEGWKESNPENQEYFEKAHLMFLDLKGLSYYQATASGVDQSWEQLADDNKIRPLKSSSSKSTTYLKYAASILVVVSAVIGIYYFQNQPTNVEIASTEAIQEIRLPDQSVISMNQGASISYKEPYRNNERRVLLEGDAYFDVRKNEHHPFVVETQGAEVRVLGTKFFVQKPDENTLLIDVEEGKVLVSYKELHQIVTEGTSLKVDMDKRELIEVADKTGVTTFWKSRTLVFNLTEAEEAIQAINQAYQTNIQLEGDTEQCFLTVTFENESIENILEVISNTLNYEIVADQGNFTLISNGCQ